MRVARLFLLLPLFLSAKKYYVYGITSRESIENYTVASSSRFSYWFNYWLSFLPYPLREFVQTMSDAILHGLYDYLDKMTSEFYEKARSTTNEYMDSVTSEFAEKVRSILDEKLHHFKDNMTSEFAERVHSIIDANLRHYKDAITSEFAEKIRSVIREEVSILVTGIFILIPIIFTVARCCKVVRHQRQQQLDTIERAVLNISERLSAEANRQAE